MITNTSSSLMNDLKTKYNLDVLHIIIYIRIILSCYTFLLFISYTHINQRLFVAHAHFK